MSGNFSEALKIFGIGFGLVIFIMIALAFIMETVGKIVTKVESKKKAEVKK
jgi:Na+-transporting methylmalonyl-CoA/oxaloacetate decarboxylase gamma subunit